MAEQWRHTNMNSCEPISMTGNAGVIVEVRNDLSAIVFTWGSKEVGKHTQHDGWGEGRAPIIGGECVPIARCARLPQGNFDTICRLREPFFLRGPFVS